MEQFYVSRNFFPQEEPKRKHKTGSWGGHTLQSFANYKECLEGLKLGEFLKKEKCIKNFTISLREEGVTLLVGP